MKKNKMMRLASVLLVLTLLSTSVISGTFAKYVTKNTATNTARVAKWGISITTGSDLFQTEYKYNSEAENYSIFSSKLDTDSVSVKSTVTSEGATADNLVAPGTSGEAYSFTVNGTPEVSYVVTFDVGEDYETVFLSKNILDQYYPVMYTITIGTQSVTNTSTLNTSLEACAFFYDVASNKYYISTTYDGVEKGWVEYVPGENDPAIPQIKISWNWNFSSSDKLDGYDTLLGNIAAGTATTAELEGYTYSTDIKLPITVTATQID